MSPLRPRTRSLSDKEVDSQQVLQHSERRHARGWRFCSEGAGGDVSCAKKSWRPIASCESCKFVQTSTCSYSIDKGASSAHGTFIVVVVVVVVIVFVVVMAFNVQENCCGRVARVRYVVSGIDCCFMCRFKSLALDTPKRSKEKKGLELRDLR